MEVIPQPAMGPSVSTDEPVRSIAVPADAPVRPTTRRPIVFNGQSAVRFLPNSTTFVDPAAARRALAPIAGWLAASQDRHAWLVGTTADVGTLAGQILLSRLRAQRVRGELIALGASGSQISIKGVGSRFPQFIPDRNAAGVLLAAPAALNRTVRITLRRR